MTREGELVERAALLCAMREAGTNEAGMCAAVMMMVRDLSDCEVHYLDLCVSVRERAMKARGGES